MKKYSGRNLDLVSFPLGGIGAGMMCIEGNGSFCSVSIRNRQPFNWEDVEEFNLCGDLLASQVIFDCDVPFIMMPCEGVSSYLTTTVADTKLYEN